MKRGREVLPSPLGKSSNESSASNSILSTRKMRHGSNYAGSPNAVKCGSTYGNSRSSCSKYRILGRGRPSSHSWMAPKPWAKQELQFRGVQDLTQAMTIAESIVAFKKVDKPDSFKSKGKGGGDRDKGKGKERDNQPKESSGSHPTAHGSPPKKGTKRKGNHKHMSKVF